MENKDLNRFTAAYLKMASALPGKDLTPEEKEIRFQVFWELLERYEIDYVEFAIEKIIKISKFFPAPAEILDILSDEMNRKLLDMQTEQRRMEIEGYLEQKSRMDASKEAKQFLEKIGEMLAEKDAKEQEEKEARRAVLREQANRILQEETERKEFL